MFEFENGLLVVDDLYIMPNNTYIVVRIDDSFYMIPSYVASGYIAGRSISKDNIRPYMSTTNKALLGKALSKHRCKSNHKFALNGTMPRGGFKVTAKRAITNDELDTICSDYGIGIDDISAEFPDKVGALFGDKYAINITSRQVRVMPTIAFEIEKKLEDMGIHALVCNSGRVNIRTA